MLLFLSSSVLVFDPVELEVRSDETTQVLYDGIIFRFFLPDVKPNRRLAGLETEFLAFRHFQQPLAT